MDLSKRRASSVKKALVKAGVKSGNITTKGYGETRPVASNDTEEGRQKNRRVEFKQQ
ncbi:Outer membrane porin F precursor [compost metagenome]